MNNKILLTMIYLLLILVCSFAVLACGGEPTGNQIVVNLTKAMQDVKTYDASMNIEFGVNYQGKNSSSINLTGEYTATINKKEKALSLSGTDSMNQKVVETMRMVILDGKTYMNRTNTGKPSVVSNHPTTQEDWNQVSSIDIEKILALLPGSDCTLLGDENIGGITCHIIKVTPDAAKLFDTVMNMPGAPSQPAASFPQLQNWVKSSVVKVWVDKKSSLLIQSECSMDVELNPADVDDQGAPEGVTLMNTSSTIKTGFSHYNAAEPIILSADVVSPTPTSPTP